MSGTIIGNNFVIVATGTTTVGGLATVTVTTLTRTASKIPIVRGFVTDNVSGATVSDSSSATIRLSIQRTTVENQFSVVASNTGATSRTINWKVFEA